MVELSQIEAHAPANWAGEISFDDLREVVVAGRPIQMIVFAADIRSSTLLMREAIDFQIFAKTIGDFVTYARKQIRKERGWFDKFTGDGFLAYWLVRDRSLSQYLHETLLTAARVTSTFSTWAEPQLRQNSHNFPAKSGISVGIDSGPAYLAEIAGELTIVGRPVVGAVRMVSAAAPNETVLNVSFGEEVLKNRGALEAVTAELVRDVRVTKEYPSGQVVYAIEPVGCEPPVG